MVKKTTFWIVPLLLILLLAACAAPSPAPTPTPSPTPTPAPAPPKPIVLKFSYYTGPGNERTNVNERASAAIEQRSGGRLKIERYPSDSLVPASKMFDGITKKLTDIGDYLPVYEAGKTPFLAAHAVTAAYDPEKFWNFMYDPGGYAELQDKYLADIGMKALARTHTVGDWFFSVKPVQKLEDVKGMLMRSPGGELRGPITKLWGMSPVTIVPAEMYTGLERRTVEFLNYSPETFISQKLYEVAKYAIVSGLNASYTIRVINVEVYNSLPADLQKILVDAWKEEEVKYDAWRLKEKENIIQQLKNLGVNVYIMPKAEEARWVAAAKPALADYGKIAGPDWPKVLALFEKYGPK